MQKITKPDWIIHAVISDDSSAEGYIQNIHTHGLMVHGCPELMISLPVAPEMAAGLINCIGMRIVRDNITLADGGRYSQFLAGDYDIMIKMYETIDEEIALIVLPDKCNRFPGEEGCDPSYAEQLKAAEAFIKH